MTRTQDSLDSYRIINMIRHVFESIDPRLMQHGERVAFLTGELYASLPGYNENDRAALLILSLLHDIGAYKTEEIDDMLHFETQNIWPHAVYGYLFLRTTTRLGETAEAILYHHAPWDTLAGLSPRCRAFAGLIHLTDRIDVLLQNDPDADMSILKSEAGALFSPEYVDMFLRRNREKGLVSRLQSGDYVLDVEDALRSLALPLDEIIEYLRMLVYAIDFRSPFTVTHTANTVAISLELVRLLGLPPDDRDAVELGAFLHDIGKILIPLTILESPGKLSDADMTIMRTHVVKTGEIISDFVDANVLNIAVRHHEKLNGSGYPQRLTEESLTLPERIVAVADIVSALISRRSYKEAFPRELTLSIIARARDAGELDPAVCNMLLTHYDEIMQNSTEWVDPVVSQYEEMMRSYVSLSAEAETLVP